MIVYKALSSFQIWMIALLGRMISASPPPTPPTFHFEYHDTPTRLQSFCQRVWFSSGSSILYKIFFFLVLQILRLFLFVAILIVICLDVDFFWSILFGSLWFLDLDVYFFPYVRNIFSFPPISYLLLSLSLLFLGPL